MCIFIGFISIKKKLNDGFSSLFLNPTLHHNIQNYKLSIILFLVWNNNNNMDNPNKDDNAFK